MVVEKNVVRRDLKVAVITDDLTLACDQSSLLNSISPFLPLYFIRDDPLWGSLVDSLLMV